MIEASVHDASKALPEGTAPAMQEGTPAAAPHAS